MTQEDDGADDGDTQPTGATVHDVEMLIGGPPTNPERPADFFFQPTGLHVQPGDVLRVRASTPDHTIVTYHPAFGMQRRVPTGVDPISSPVLGWDPATIPGDMIDPPGEGGESESGDEGEDGMGTDSETDEESPTPTLRPQEFLFTVRTPGVYDFLCSPHEAFGMAMRLVVGDVTDAPFETSDPSALAEPRAGPVGLARVTLTDPALEPAAIVEAGTVLWEDLESVSGGAGGESSSE
ncbi:plastocyanin/azurin family copper-binding protein [Halorarius litoreus]|uniref:plastocyanin/azurin family copper-binding protein n=1 Tax=Halorarius litoreus TaxID=2962676 RepID=UPI0020CEAB2B|nr:plastocyanin/azurin family copper-binding protein [Halorarius litoreus]